MTKQNTALKSIGNIPFIDLAFQQSLIQNEIKTAIDKVLAHGKYIMGPEVTALEETLSKACGAKHTISCSSGTDALVMALMALGIKSGDAVLVPSFTFAATAEAVAILGATPVFVDVNEDDYNISLSSLKSAYDIAKNDQLNVAGIIAVDLFGLPAEYDAIEDFAKTNNLWVMADAAQSFGGKYKDKPVGLNGLITTTSFFPAKPLGCYGDGGAIFTDDDEIADILRSIRVHGKGSDKYDNVRLGVNGRLDTIQAAILLEKHKIFENEIEKRNKVACYYNEGLKNIVKIPVIDNHRLSAWAQYTVQVENAEERSRITAELKEAGIPTAIYYPLPLHQQTCYKDYPASPDMSICKSLSQKVFSLPMHPYLTTETQDYIIEALKKAAG
tara:strand:- start:361 stop:1518 length:1158 start_codon:yes stop_codon:yes gene_type:complete